MERWNKFIAGLVGTLRRVGGLALVGMMVVTCFDVLTRKAGHAVFGLVEIVTFMATLVLACAMPLTHVEGGHVGVDLVVRKLKPRWQNIIDAATSFLATVVFALTSWQMFLYAGTIRRSGEVSMSLEFPAYILVYSVAVAFGVLALVIAGGCIGFVRKAVRP